MTETTDTQATPQKPRKLPRLVQTFIDNEASAGLFMMFAAAAALLIANTGLSDWYKAFVNAPMSFTYGELIATHSLKEWVKDILMVLFFLIIGMELKAEMKEGFLAKRDQILLPLLGAVGGMAIPAIVYLGYNFNHPENWAGWAIPSATDIAFALAVLLLIGRGIPPAVKIFLLAIAIFDDLGAIMIIALFYSSGLAATPLLLAALGGIILYLLNRSNVTSFTPYMLVGVFMWFCFFHGGIHTTIAGVLVGMAIPMRDADNPNHSPLKTGMHFLHGWVNFFVLPVFAFTAAGISFKDMNMSSFLHPVPMGIAMGLFFGKQIGIFSLTWLAVKLGIASKPAGANWLHIYAVSIIAGIGFTMSLFIGILAFRGNAEMEELIKLGVIAGSLLSTIWGAFIMKLAVKLDKKNAAQEEATA